MDELNSADAVVIGAGHSGCEAAKSIACEGFRTLLLNINLDAIALVSGDPLMNISGADVGLIDRIGIMERPVGMIERNMLVIDKREYFIYMKECMENIEYLQVRQAEVTGIIEQNGGFLIRSRLGDEYRAKAVVICAGTFLKARCVYDGHKTPGGRHGEIASDDLCKNLEEMGYEFTDSAVSSLHVVRIASELEEECERKEIKYYCSKTNSKTTSKYCYLYKLEDDHLLLFVPLGVRSFEYYVSKYYSKDVPVEVFNSNIKRLEDKFLIMPTRAPCKVKYRVLKSKYFIGSNKELSVQGGMFFAGAMCGSTSIFQSIIDGITAGRDAVSYLKSKVKQS